MKLRVVRFSPGKEATLGLLYIDGVFACFTLEDEMRDVKVKGETAIPNGTYDLRLRTWGGFHERYAKADHWTGGIHEGMIEVMDVPGFTDILIHTGNLDKHTDGCLLVGDGVSQNVTDLGSLTGSRTAYKRIYPQIRKAMQDGVVTITYEVLGA
jgi:hypothetical protein